MKIEVHGNFKMRKKGFNIAITMWIYVHQYCHHYVYLCTYPIPSKSGKPNALCHLF